jgi:hypothetical protein
MISSGSCRNSNEGAGSIHENRGVLQNTDDGFLSGTYLSNVLVSGKVPDEHQCFGSEQMLKAGGGRSGIFSHPQLLDYFSPGTGVSNGRDRAYAGSPGFHAGRDRGRGAPHFEESYGHFSSSWSDNLSDVGDRWPGFNSGRSFEEGWPELIKKRELSRYLYIRFHGRKIRYHFSYPDERIAITMGLEEFNIK